MLNKINNHTWCLVDELVVCTLSHAHSIIKDMGLSPAHHHFPFNKGFPLTNWNPMPTSVPQTWLEAIRNTLWIKITVFCKTNLLCNYLLLAPCSQKYWLNLCRESSNTLHSQLNPCYRSHGYKINTMHRLNAQDSPLAHKNKNKYLFRQMIE